MKSKRKKKSTRKRDLLSGFNARHIMQMTQEEKKQLKRDSDSFFDNLPYDFFTDPRYEEGLEHLKNTDKDECHKSVMALLFL